MMRLISFSDRESLDLIEALRDAQNELCCGPGFPEANRLYKSWEKLIHHLEVKTAISPTDK